MRNYILVILLLMGTFAVAAELDIDDCWEILLANNQQLQSEQLGVQSKEADVKLSFYDLLPSGSLSGSYNRTGESDLESDNMNYRVSLTQPIYQGGKLVNSLSQSEKSLLQSQENYEKLLLTLRFELESKYYNVLKLTESLSTVENELSYLETNLETAQLRFENGNLSRGDVLQLRSQTAQKQVALLKAENSLQIAENELKNFMVTKENVKPVSLDMEIYNEVISSVSMWQIAELNEKEQTLLAYALENNPSLKASEISVEISEKGMESAKGSFMPSVSLNLSNSWNYQEWDDDPDGNMSLGLSVSLPIFPVVDNIQKYAKSRYSLRQSELSLSQEELALELDMKSALLNLAAAVQGISAAEISRDYAQESYQQAEENFRNRMITANELLNIQISLTTAENALTNATYDFLGYKGELQNVLGVMDEGELWQLIR